MIMYRVYAVSTLTSDAYGLLSKDTLAVCHITQISFTDATATTAPINTNGEKVDPVVTTSLPATAPSTTSHFTNSGLIACNV